MIDGKVRVARQWWVKEERVGKVLNWVTGMIGGVCRKAEERGGVFYRLNSMDLANGMKKRRKVKA